MHDYLPIEPTKKSFNLKWLLGIGCVFGLVCFAGLQTEHGSQLKGYIQDEIFVTYMDEQDMKVGEAMEEVYDENSELMNVADELVGVHHVFDEKNNKLVPLENTAELEKIEIDKKTSLATKVIGVNNFGILVDYHDPSFSRFRNGNFFALQNNAWVIKSGGLTNVAIGDDGYVWGVNDGYYIFRYQAASNTWVRVLGLLKQVDIGKQNLVWGVNKDDYIFRWTGSAWQNIPGRLKDVSVGSDGTVWGVNAYNWIYRWNGKGWQHIPGLLKQISVGSSTNIWGVNHNDDIFRWTGSAWQHISGKLIWICVSKTGSVWGVNAHNDIFYRKGNTWGTIPGKLRQIDCR